MAYLQIVGGLFLLVLSGEFMVRGSVSMARRLGVSTLAIGLTIIAFGTSAPELVVGVDAVLTKVPTLALGNVVGSNIANVWLVLGLPALVAPMVCTAPRYTHNLAILTAVTLLFMVIAWSGQFTVFSGIVLITLLIAFLFYSAKRPKGMQEIEAAIEDIEGEVHEPDTIQFASLFVFGGLVGLVLGAHVLVLGSVEVARDLGVSEALIGLTLVAVGTSVPELVTSIIASLRGHCDVAIGNVIGSNIFNLLGIIGVASFFGNIPVPPEFLKFDLWIMLIATFSLLPFALFHRRVGRVTGIIFMLAYLCYLFLLAHGAFVMSSLVPRMAG